MSVVFIRVRRKLRFAPVYIATIILSVNPTASSFAAATNGWSSSAPISPLLQPDPTRGSQLNDVATNASGQALAAWDQYTYNNGGGATIGIAVQSGGRWAAPFTISAASGFSMTPKVAVGADGTMAVAWTYQDPATNPNPQQKIQVAVKAAGNTQWNTCTLAQGPIGGMALTQFVPVAIDNAGSITAAWSIWDGTKHLVQTARRTAGLSGTWAVAETVSANIDGIYPTLSVNGSGDAGVAFVVSPYTSSAGSCDPLQPSLQGSCVLYAFRSGPGSAWTAPVNVSEIMSSSIGYISTPHVALDAGGLATVIYMGAGLEATRQVSASAWTNPQAIIRSNVVGASYLSPDLAVDANGNAVVAVSIFDPTPGVDRASVWAARGTAAGIWNTAQRLTDPTLSVDAYATQAALSPNGALALIGWIDHYHSLAQVTKWTGSAWGKATTIGKSTAFASFQEVMGLDAASDISGSAAQARAIWKSAKTGTQIYASGYSQ